MSQPPLSVREEIKQGRPFASLGAETVITLFRTADRLRTRFAQLLEPYGLSTQQYNVLRILRGAKQVLPTLEIAERMVERSPGITRLLDRLEAKGLVHRERCHVDRRLVYCGITERGLEVLAELDQPVLALDHEILDVLSENEQRQLISLLDRVRHAAPA